MRTFSIDPGIRGSGWALWQGNTLIKAGVITSRVEDWQEAGEQVAAQLHDIGRKSNVDGVFCEFPAFFQSQGGQVTAKSGSLVKLAWFTGFLSALFRTDFVPFNFVEVNTWKGQLPKSVVETRIRRTLRPKENMTLKSHAYDAVGIGLFVHGRMK